MQQDIHVICETASPRLHVFEGPVDDLMGRAGAFSQQLLVRKLDAQNMKTQDGFYDELSRALEFPDYFGRNLNALDECITDLDWLSVAGGILIVIASANVLLTDSADDLFEGFVSVLRDAGEEWSHPVEQGEAWDRPGLPFHVVFQVVSDSRSGLDAKLRGCSVEIGELK